MDNLLKQWSEIEPERCEVDKVGIAWVKCDGNGMRKAHKIGGAVDAAVVQSAVQLVLEPTDWPWGLNRIRRADGGIAYVCRIQPDAIGTSTSSECSATAMLETYLAVLRHKPPTPSPSTQQPHDHAPTS